MKAKLHSNTRIEAADRDSVIGSAVSKAIADASTVSPCPQAEELAVLLDGTAAEEERNSLFGHMAACGRCRESYLLAQDLRSEEPAQPGHRGWYMAGGTVAAALLVVLAIKLAIQEPAVTVPQAVAQTRLTQVAQGHKAIATPPAIGAQQKQPGGIAFSAAAAARQLAKAVSTDSLAAAIGAPATDSYGFAGNDSSQATGFRVGRELFEVELWLAAGDRERAGLAAERLIPLLRGVRSDVSSTATLDDLLRQLEAGQLDEVSLRLDIVLKEPHKGIIHLGGWVSAARVAIESGKDPYFNGNPPQHFLKELGTNLTPAARDILGKLDKSRVGKDPAEIRRLLDILATAV